jgi:serine protease Do
MKSNKRLATRSIGTVPVSHLTRLFILATVSCLLAVGCHAKGFSLPAVPQNPTKTVAGIRTSFADVISRVTPAVVTIETQTRTRPAEQFPFMNDPFFRQFFGDRAPQQMPEQRLTALGSGVIVTNDGYILTNHHVIDGAEKIRVTLNGNRTVDAKLIGSDAPSDLAVLKIDATNLPVLVLGNSDDVRVGDVVLAIGNPLNVGQTVTMGIISAKGRQTGLSNGSFEDFLQTDAPINKGNSGGALIDSTGDLIGINSQILSPTGGSIGIGFAIPSNMARNVMDPLVKSGKVRRGQLGIVVQKISNDIAANLGLKETKGVIVSQVQPGSAAERAGIKFGDVILSLNGKAVDEPNVLRNEIAGTGPGTNVTLTILREGQERTISASLGEFNPPKNEITTSNNNQPPSGGPTGKLGISVSPFTSDMAQQLGVAASTQGVVVGQVDPNGPAADAGIQQGDVIEQVNQQPVRSAADVRTALERSGGTPALLLVNRRGTVVFLTVRPKA